MQIMRILPSSHRSIKGRGQDSFGFSLIELTIVTAMMGILLSIVIVNLRNSQHRIAANTSAELVASALRTMQNNALSGLPKPSGSTATNYGMLVTLSTPTQYRTYADLNLGLGQELISSEGFVPGIEIRNISVDGDAANSLNITFDLPYGNIQLNGDGGLANLGIMEVVHTASGYGKRVIIKANTGDIEIRNL